MTALPDIAAVRAAAERIAGAVLETPCVPSPALGRIVGCELWLKFENLQTTGSFKERGALNRLLALTPDERTRGVVAMSAGNHAQGVAAHAARLGIPATIVMPIGTPLTKITRTRDHGARVVIAGANLSEAGAEALRLVDDEGLVLIHPYDDPAIIAGQGSCGLEMLAAVPDAEVLVVPVGGGGLISGIAIAARAIRPDIRIVGVQSRTYPAMVRALAGGEDEGPDGITIAEGIAVKAPGRLTRRIIAEQVDDILLVGEASLERAVALLLSVEKTVVEGAGAAGLAAIIEYPEVFAGKRVVTPLCGGNIDLRILASVAMRDLVRSGRLVRFEVPISDQPGVLARLATLFAEHGANIVDVGHDRLSLSLNPRGAVLDVTIEVQDRAHGDRVLAAVEAIGFAVRQREVG